MRWRRRRRPRRSDPRVERVLICTPDKDLAQCVRGTRVVQLDRRTRTIRDEAGVVAKFGVPPASIPDYLALVGDAPDGYPGPAGLGREIGGGRAGASSGTSNRFRTTGATWGVNAPSAGALAATLARERERAFLFRDLATLRTDIPLFDSLTTCGGKGRRRRSRARRAARRGRHSSGRQARAVTTSLPAPGPPPPARTDADASSRIYMSSTRHGRRRVSNKFVTG